MRTKVFAGIGQRVDVLNYGEGTVTAWDIWKDVNGHERCIPDRRGIRLDHHTLPMNPAYFWLNELTELGDSTTHEYSLGTNLGYPKDHPLYWERVCIHCSVPRLRGLMAHPESLCRGRVRPLYR